MKKLFLILIFIAFIIRLKKIVTRLIYIKEKNETIDRNVFGYG